jgi:hypothetical protein
MMWRCGAWCGALGAVASMAAGCSPRCGFYEHQTGVTWDMPRDGEEPESIDGYTLHEICGPKLGTVGHLDLLDDGVAHIRFDGSHRSSHVAITLTSGVYPMIYFKRSALEVGAVLTTPDLLGQSEIFDSIAHVQSMSGARLAPARLTAGTVEVLDVRPNAFWQADAYRLRFDLTWGEPGVSEFWYTAEGEDWIAML